MNCPNCNNPKPVVVGVLKVQNINATQREYECTNCNYKFITEETITKNAK